jgi:hypothetical protein
VPTVSADAAYIAGLAALVAAAQRNGETVLPDAGRRRCPERFTLCACGEPVR